MRAHVVRASETHDRFLEMLPRIRKIADRRLRHHGAEAREEMTAEAVALAFDMYRRLVERGVPELAYATPLAVYACRQVVSGRRLGGSLNVNEVGSLHCRQRHGVRVTSLQQRDVGDNRWRAMVVESWSTPRGDTGWGVEFHCTD